ncbi:hypothetical protein [Polyangium sp. y55x31]|uniref:hypothetical protein n=1 Tax=Polyangium sp. y55x31 TaxID=3042688 RepID=UPI002482749E|nr:hypothetical protein [Polyangium sp. y55x31]MDI1479740.1 hypothetical protein [Polyangium sp. y55x31]
MQSKPAFGASPPRSPHPATVAQPKLAPHAAKAPVVVQRMDQELPSYKELLRIGQYEKQPTIIVTLSYDGNEQSSLFGTSKSFYQSTGCNVLNDPYLTYDVNQGVFLDSKKTFKKYKNGMTDLLLVVTTHGNVQWLFGTNPGNEGVAIQAFVQELHRIEQQLGNTVIFSRIVLDACWSAAELKYPQNGVANDCPARILSQQLGQNYSVYGFNGKAASGIVNYIDESGNHAKGSYAENVVIFVNGNVIKGTTHGEQGQGVNHSTKNMGNPFYTNTLFGGELPGRYRSNSFSS